MSLNHEEIKGLYAKTVPLEVDYIKSELIKCCQKISDVSCATLTIAALQLYIDLSVQLGVRCGLTLKQIKSQIINLVTFKDAEIFIEKLYDECIEKVKNGN